MITFFKKYYRILSAVVLSLVFVGYYFQTFSSNYKEPFDEFQKKFQKMERALDNALRYQEETLESDISEQWKNIKEDNTINIHVYRNDSLILWNTNQIPVIRFADIHYPSNGLLHLQNGWYYAKTREIGDYLVCASFLIKQDYSYKNNELINDFSPELDLPFGAKVSVDSESEFKVISKDKGFVFSIQPNEYQSATQTESIVLMLLLLIAIILWLIWLTKVKEKLPIKLRWLIPLTVVVLHLLSLKYSWFGFMHGTLAFDPSLYGASWWSPNFFVYLLNIAIFVYLLKEIKAQLKRWKPSVLNKYLALGLFIATFVIWIVYLFITKGLIEDSSIPLVVDKLFSLNVFSVLAFCGLGVFFYAYFHFVHAVVELCKRQDLTGAQLAVTSFIVSCTFFFYEINYGYELLFAALFPLIFYELILYLVYRHVKSNQMGTGIVLLLLFSIVMAQTISSFNERKERGERELYAQQLITERDIVTEVEYAAIAEKLTADNFLRKFIEAPHFISVAAFQEGIERRVFNGFWERYEMKFKLFSENGIPLIDNRTGTTDLYEELQEIISQSGKASEIDSNIYFIGDYAKQYSYIVRQEIYGKDSTKAILFCTLKSKKIPEEIGFPRLLISSKANVLESLEAYSIGKYHNRRLITKYGAYKYPSSDEIMLPSFIEEKGFYDYEGYNHFVLKRSDSNSVVLSKKNRTIVDFITSFSYLFTFFGLLLLPLVFRLNSEKGFSSTLTLALKIQVVLISLVFISLLAFGWGSGVFVSNQYHEFTNDVIREKLSSVETELNTKVNTIETLTIADHGNTMQFLLQNFAKVFFTDINMYDVDGYLVASSRPKVFNVGLLSEQMNPIAFKHIKHLKKSEFIQTETIGQLDYSSAYQPIYNAKNSLLGYINLQHFGQQREFENQIQKFLVAIINVFILLLAISIILAIFISNWLTAPLRILQSSFSRVKFGKHNEQIKYEKDDEIGALVKDYNKKLEELEFAAQQLAKNEREIAWREMAKQVAHEIKNPLTPMKLSVQHLLRSHNPEDPKSADKLKAVANSIIEQIDALTKIANEFSTFAKMPVPNEEKIELVQLINNVIELFTGEENINVSVTSYEEKVFILGDKDQFVRVFNNLIKNAVQAIPKDKDGKVEIKLPQERKQIVISISDNGVGIDDSQRSKIFVPYFTTKNTGTGLGLAMVKQIIENHKGTIEFESLKDQGTTFIIKLPQE